jgi:hypothetical protein
VAQRVERLAPTAGLAPRDSKFQVHRGRARLFSRERFQYLERRLRLAGETMRRGEDEARARVARDCSKNFAGLLGGEARSLFEKTRSVGERYIKRSKRLRSTVQWNIPRIQFYSWLI